MRPTELSSSNHLEFQNGDGDFDIEFSLTNFGFEFEFTQTNYSSAQGAGSFLFGAIYFTVDEDVLFDASGTHRSLSGNAARFSGLLFEAPTGPFVFLSEQTSEFESISEFSFGGSDGNLGNGNQGELTGVLVAGQDYGFRFSSDSWNLTFPSETGGSSGRGTVRLGLTPIPEPTTASLLGIGLALLGVKRRARR